MRIKLIFLMLFCFTGLSSQDVNFSQAYMSGSYLNPALSGVFNGFVRFSSLYREQGRGSFDTPFKTYAITSDIRYKLKLFSQTEHDILGVGLYYLNDRVDIYDFNTNAIALSIAFHKSLDARRPHYIGVGFQGGVFQRNINFDNLTFEDMFNKVDGYPFPTMEPIPSNNFASGDFSMGLYYTITTRRDMTLSAGFAYQHFGQPNISFYRTETVIENTNSLHPKYTFHAMFDTKIAPFARLQPRAKIVSQGDFTDVMLGANYRFTSFDRDFMALHLGLSVHTVSDLGSYYIGPIVPFVGFQVRTFMLGFSYDIVMTHLVNSRRNLNTFEFTVSYLGEVEDEGMVCPQF